MTDWQGWVVAIDLSIIALVYLLRLLGVFTRRVE